MLNRQSTLQEVLRKTEEYTKGIASENQELPTLEDFMSDLPESL